MDLLPVAPLAVLLAGVLIQVVLAGYCPGAGKAGWPFC